MEDQSYVSCEKEEKCVSALLCNAAGVCWTYMWKVIEGIGRLDDV